MGRRANGEGSIYQRADGRWAAAITLANKRRTTLYGRTREDVGKKLTALLKNRDDGLPVANSQLTVGAYVEDWLASVKPTLRATTWARYDQLMRGHVVPRIGTVKLSKLGPQHLSRLYADLLVDGKAPASGEKPARGLKPATVVQTHRVLHRALSHAARWGLVVRNVATLVDAPRVTQEEMQTLSPAEVKRFLAKANGHRLHALFALAISTGMREGELLALRWRHVDLDAGVLQVMGTLQRTPEGMRISEPKTKKSRRQIHLTRTAIDALKAHRVRQNEERLRMGPVWEDNDLVFTNTIGRYVNTSNMLNREYRPLLEKAGLPKIRFHDLRHTAATLMLGAGVHPKVVSEMLGHSQIAVTMDLYSHVTPTMQAQAAAAMDGVLG